MDREQAAQQLKKSQRDLDDAIMVVARCAQDVSDNAEPFDDLFAVEPEDMTELRNALAHWKKCTETFLRALDAYQATVPGCAANEERSDAEGRL